MTTFITEHLFMRLPINKFNKLINLCFIVNYITEVIWLKIIQIYFEIIIRKTTRQDVKIEAYPLLHFKTLLYEDITDFFY